MTDEELIARLREIQGQAGLFASAAADRIEALVKERDEALEWLSASQGYIADAVFALDKQEKAEARAERLEAAVSAVADDVCSYICPSVGKADAPIPHDPRCIALRAALTQKEQPDGE